MSYNLNIQYIKGPTNVRWFNGCNFIAFWSPACFGHSCGHLQGGENNNTNTIKMGRNHSTVYMHLINSRNVKHTSLTHQSFPYLKIILRNP